MATSMIQTLASLPGKPDNLTDAEYLEELGRMRFQGKEAVTLGCIIFGFGIDLFFCGVMVHQIVQWASNYREERRFNVVITFCVAVAALGQTSLNIFYVWSMFITGYGQYTEMLKLDKVTVFIALAVATTIPVQVFFLERAWRLLRKPWWFFPIMTPPMLLSLMGGLACPIVATTLPSFLEVSGIANWLYVWGVGTVAADLLLTGFMMYGLSKNKTGWSNTDRFIDRLIRATIETQVPGTLFGVAFVISMSIQIVSYGNIMLEMFHSKVYVVCLLAVLNYRYTLRKDMPAGSGGHLEDGRIRENTFALRSRHQQANIPLDRIQVDTVIQRTSYEAPEDKKGLNRGGFTDDESGRSENLETPDEFASTVILTADGGQH